MHTFTFSTEMHTHTHAYVYFIIYVYAYTHTHMHACTCLDVPVVVYTILYVCMLAHLYAWERVGSGKGLQRPSTKAASVQSKVEKAEEAIKECPGPQNLRVLDEGCSVVLAPKVWEFGVKVSHVLARVELAFLAWQIVQAQNRLYASNIGFRHFRAWRIWLAPQLLSLGCHRAKGFTFGVCGCSRSARSRLGRFRVSGFFGLGSFEALVSDFSLARSRSRPVATVTQRLFNKSSTQEMAMSRPRLLH